MEPKVYKTKLIPSKLIKIIKKSIDEYNIQIKNNKKT